MDEAAPGGFAGGVGGGVMAPRRSSSAETAARFFALRGDPNAVLYDILAKERARQSRVHRARQAVKALTPSEFEEFLAEMITRYHDMTTGAPRAKGE